MVIFNHFLTKILREQCVNILFQLGVFSDIHRKSPFYKSLIISTLFYNNDISQNIVLRYS